jgi:hypothetical protein
VLDNKGNVVDDADVAEGELDGVTGNAAPVALDVAVDGLLGDAEDSACNVKQDSPDTPAVGALVAPVDDELRGVLDEGDDDLDVADGVDDVELAPVAGRVDGAARPRGLSAGDDEAGASDAEDAAGGDAQGEARRPRAGA